MSQTFDVIIVGAGVIGCSSAFRIAQRGLSVCVLDKGTIGCGGTGRSSAIIRQHYSNKLTARMALDSLRVFQEFDAVVGGEVGFTQTGFLAISSQEDLVGLQSNVALQQAVGIDTQFLTPADLRQQFPYLDSGEMAGAAYEPEGGYADPHLTVNAFADAARRLGVQFKLNQAVTGIKIEAGCVAGVETGGGFLAAPMVINCAGAWGGQVGEMAGIELPVKACRVQVSQFVRPAGQESAHPVVVDFVHGSYLRSETGGITLAGLIDPSEADAVVDPDAYAEHLDDDFVTESGEKMIARYPALIDARSTGGYASLYSVTPDWHPIVDEIGQGSGLFVCTGFSGHGFKLAPAVGVMVADMVTGTSEPEYSTHLFRANRYAEGEPVRGTYEYSIAG
jgi:sarcosine oxidase subunit beta